jgi:membrane protein
MISDILGFLFTVSLFYVFYRFCPARGLKGTALWAACLVGAILFEVSKWAFAWYISFAGTYALFYGTLSGFLFFLLWLYYASLVFILSSTVGWVMQNRAYRS